MFICFFFFSHSQDLSPFKKSVPLNRADVDPDLNRFSQKAQKDETAF